MTLSESVAAIEKQNDRLRLLADEILDSLEVNRLRGTITSIDDQDFTRIIEAWKTKFFNIINEIP